MRRRLGTNLVAALLLAFPCTHRAAAVDIDPVFSAQMLTGQYFFTGGRSSLGGDLSVLVAPAMRFNEQWDLYPSLSSSYKGTKDVMDLMGAGTVLQEQMRHRLGVKGVYRPPDTKWKVKPSVSYTAKLLKETRDEQWGDGLFDNRKLNVGVEGEYVYKDPFSVRFGVDYFNTRFPHYTSLESQASTDFQGETLARELVGDRILDSHGQMLSASGHLPLGKIVVAGNYALMLQQFPNQMVVVDSGDLSSDKRNDTSQSLRAGIRFPWNVRHRLKLVLSIDMGVKLHTSDQNSYDAFQMKFIEGHYDYREHSRGIGAQMTAGDPERPTRIGVDLTFTDRNYLSRPIQAETGLYKDETLDTRNLMLSGTVSRPLAPRFKALFTVQHGISSSNQEFAQFYTYDYTATNYLLGVSYDY
ncbi:hypothetical protein ACFL2T_04580 [Elusimicrobiota bacterium]